MAEEDDQWPRVWNARADALAQVLGSPYDNVLHAPHPFRFGGQAEVIVFSNHLKGAVYVTAELTGDEHSTFADYELMICHRSPQNWGPNVISRLAPYTQQARIDAEETMNIDGAAPPDSQIKALIFDTYGSFPLFGRTFELRLCVGITKPELQFKFDYGAKKLLALLKKNGVYPFTDLERQSIALDL